MRAFCCAHAPFCPSVHPFFMWCVYWKVCAWKIILVIPRNLKQRVITSLNIALGLGCGDSCIEVNGRCMEKPTEWKNTLQRVVATDFFYFFCPSILFVCLFEKCLSVIGHQQAVTAQEQVVQQPERSLVWLSWLHVEASLNIILNPIFFLISRLAHCIVAIERLYKKIYRNARQFTISDICLRLPHLISIFLDVVMLDSSVFLRASPIDVMFYSSYKKRRDSVLPLKCTLGSQYANMLIIAMSWLPSPISSFKVSALQVKWTHVDNLSEN